MTRDPNDSFSGQLTAALRQVIEANPASVAPFQQYAERKALLPTGGGTPGFNPNSPGGGPGGSSDQLTSTLLGSLPGLGGGLAGIAGPVLGGVMGAVFPSGASPSMLPNMTGGCFPGAGSGPGLTDMLSNAGQGLLNSVPGMLMGMWQPGPDASAAEVAGHAVAGKLMKQLQAAGFDPTAMWDKLNSLFTGLSSSASVPLALGSKNKSSVVINEAFYAVRVTDPAEFPAEADLGQVLEGNPTVLAGDLAVSGEGHLSLGAVKGTIGGIELVSPNVLMGKLSVVTSPTKTEVPSLPDASAAPAAAGGGDVPSASPPPSQEPATITPPRSQPANPPAGSPAAGGGQPKAPVPASQNSSPTAATSQNQTPNPTATDNPTPVTGAGTDAGVQPPAEATPTVPATQNGTPVPSDSETPEATAPPIVPAEPGPAPPEQPQTAQPPAQENRTIGDMYWDLLMQRLNRQERDQLLAAVEQYESSGFWGAMSGITGLPALIRAEIAYQNNRGNFWKQAQGVAEIPKEVAKNVVMNKAAGYVLSGAGSGIKATLAWGTSAVSKMPPALAAFFAKIARMGKNVRVYRIEGAPNTRLVIGEDGSVAVVGDQMLFLNFGNKAHADAWLAKRVGQGMEGATIKSFEVPKSFLQELRAMAVPESLAKQFPDSPLVVDVTKAADQFGLRPEQINQLLDNIVSGSGRVGS